MTSEMSLSDTPVSFELVTSSTADTLGWLLCWYAPRAGPDHEVDVLNLVSAYGVGDALTLEESRSVTLTGAEERIGFVCVTTAPMNITGSFRWGEHPEETIYAANVSQELSVSEARHDVVPTGTPANVLRASTNRAVAGFTVVAIVEELPAGAGSWNELVAQTLPDGRRIEAPASGYSTPVGWNPPDPKYTVAAKRTYRCQPAGESELEVTHANAGAISHPYLFHVDGELFGEVSSLPPC